MINMHHNPKMKQNRVNRKIHLWCFSIITIFSRALHDLLTKSKSGLPLVLTRYSLDLELSCETRIVEKIGREMDIGGRIYGENFWREKGKMVWFCNSKLQNQFLTKHNHTFYFQSIPFITNYMQNLHVVSFHSPHLAYYQVGVSHAWSHLLFTCNILCNYPTVFMLCNYPTVFMLCNYEYKFLSHF